MKKKKIVNVFRISINPLFSSTVGRHAVRIKSLKLKSSKSFVMKSLLSKNDCFSVEWFDWIPCSLDTDSHHPFLMLCTYVPLQRTPIEVFTTAKDSSCWLYRCLLSGWSLSALAATTPLHKPTPGCQWHVVAPWWTFASDEKCMCEPHTIFNTINVLASAGYLYFWICLCVFDTNRCISLHQKYVRIPIMLLRNMWISPFFQML